MIMVYSKNLEYLIEKVFGHKYEIYKRKGIAESRDRFQETEESQLKTEESADKKFVFTFEEGSFDMVNLLGGKGANLAGMIRRGVPVPSGFTITTEAFHEYNRLGELSDIIKSQVLQGINYLNKKTEKKFGSSKNPLLVSVRSGAPISMPGMMDTILNLGMNYEIAESLIKKTKNPVFVHDTYSRFIKMFADVVFEMNQKLDGYTETRINQLAEKYFCKDDFVNGNSSRRHQMHESFFERIHTALYIYHSSETKFPTDPQEQLFMAVKAVFDSWDSRRANSYRKEYNIDYGLGTAVNVQAMVFGNQNKESFSGVAFSRNKDTGVNKVSGEYLLGAQGEDVVSGKVTPLDIRELHKANPRLYAKLIKRIKSLEQSNKDMQDVEFTYDGRKLWFLQTRHGKRSSLANVRMALDMRDEGLISREEVFDKISYEDLESILSQVIVEPSKNYTLLGKGEPSIGVAIGKVALSNEEAAEYKQAGYDVILVRHSTDTEDIAGIRNSEGILTAVGGSTSHAAIVAKGMNKVCITGCKNMEVLTELYDEGVYFTSDKGSEEKKLKLSKGDFISLDGNNGLVYKGKVNTISKEDNQLVERLENLLFEMLDPSDLIVNFDSVVDLEFAHEKSLDVGIFNNVSWFAEGNNLKALRDYLFKQGRGGFPESLVKVLSRKYAAIFKKTQGDVYCGLFDKGYQVFIPNSADTDTIQHFVLENKSFFTSKYRKSIKNLTKRAEAVQDVSSKRVRSLDYGMLKAQIKSIVLGAKKAQGQKKTSSCTPVINFSDMLLDRYGKKALNRLFENTVKMVKEETKYKPQVNISFSAENNKLVFRPDNFVVQAFDYCVKNQKGDE